VIRRLVVLVLLIGGAYLLRPLQVPTEGVIAPKSLFLFGILLLVADTLGGVAKDLKVPRIIGYIVAGALLGPSLTGLVPLEVLDDLGMMKSLALGLIGLLAGAELRIQDLKSHWRAVLATLLAQALFVTVALVPTLFLLKPWLPVPELGTVAFLAVALLFTVMMLANSPMVVLALLSEGRSSGPLAKTTLSMVLVADVVVILFFTIAMSGVSAAMGVAGEAHGGQVFLGLLAEIGVSLLAGVLLGGLITLYVRYVKRELVLFAVVVVFATAAAAEALHFEMLLSLVVAGFLFENVAPVRGGPLLKALEKAATPVFVVFFALTAAELALGSFVPLLPVVLVIVVVRGVAVWAAARVGSAIGGADEVVRRDLWTGLVPQAGVTLGFAALVAAEFSALGAGFQALTVGVVTLNTTIGPVLFRRALGRAGELEEG
jgi:Kef-type K+ transport system membrane component KefB